MLTPRVHGADKQTTTKKSEQGQRWTYTHSSSQRPVKNVGHKRAGPFLFSLRIARMHRAEPGSPFTGEPASGNDGLRKGEERRNHIAEGYAYNAIYSLIPHPAYIGPSLIREGTHELSYLLLPFSSFPFARLVPLHPLFYTLTL